jgi:hypothetical protein
MDKNDQKESEAQNYNQAVTQNPTLQTFQTVTSK